MLFFKKHDLTIGQPIPCGYRATWQNKSKLAVSKLHSKLSNETNKSDFPGIVINDDAEDSDFIEAHLYGAVHKEIFESVSILGMGAKEKALFNAYKSDFSDQGINVNIE